MSLKSLHLKSLTAAICCSFITTPAFAYDLNTAYQFALDNDIQYQIETTNLQAAKATLPQAQSAFKPQVSAQAKGTWLDSDRDNANASFDNTSTAGSIQYSQVLYNRQSSASTEGAEAGILQAQMALKIAQNNLIVRTAEAYFDILAAEDNLQFAQTEKKAIARQLEQAQKRFEVGLIAITDVKEAEARYDTSVAQELAAQNQLDISIQSLQLITGPIDGEINPVNKSIPLSNPQPNSSEHWTDLAMQENLDVLSAQAGLSVAAANRKKAKNTISPTVTVNGSYGITSSDHSLSGSDTAKDATIGITLNYPLYTGGSSSAQIAEQEAKYQSAKSRVLLQKRVASQQARSLYLTVISGISQINALKKAYNSSQTALEATNAGFDVGTRTSVDVLTAIKDTFRAQRDESSSRYEYLINLLKLNQAVGRLSQANIDFINQYVN